MRPFQVLEVKAQCVVGFTSGGAPRSGGEGLKSSWEIAWGTSRLLVIVGGSSQLAIGQQPFCGQGKYPPIG